MPLSIGDLITARQGKQPPQAKTRGKRAEDGGLWCICCLLEVAGTYFICDECYNYGLCFKCYRSRSDLHAQHSFRDEGEEWNDDNREEAEGSVSGDAVPKEANDAVSGDGEPNPEQESSNEEFDDEIVG